MLFKVELWEIFISKLANRKDDLRNSAILFDEYSSKGMKLTVINFYMGSFDGKECPN